jgi:hypothetical protein
LLKDFRSLFIFSIIFAFSLCVLNAPTIYGQAEITRVKTDTNTNVPKALTLKETGLGQVMQGTSTFAKGFEAPLVAVIQNGKTIRLVDENYPGRSTFQIASYNPTLIFQFGKGSKTSILNIQQLFVGKIKSYANSTEAIQSGSLFKHIGLNEDTVLKLEENGPSYMVLDVLFGKNISGIYSVTFENSPYGDKSSDRTQLTSELAENNWKVANSSAVKVNHDDSFMSVVQSVMCHTSSSYGFKICKNTNPVKAS